MAKFEFYRGNLYYYLKIFYYKYKNPLFKFMTVVILLFVLVALLDIFLPQPLIFNNYAFKIALSIALILLSFVGVAFLKAGYITGYSLLKDEEEMKESIVIQWKQYLKFYTQVIAGLALLLGISYLFVSFILNIKFGIPYFK